LDDIVGNEETIDRLKVIAKDGNCPHVVISVNTHGSDLVTA
jgi:replication factor C subunit 2/4